ncbi:helix-turn-helix domain-containing protein [Cupriavidus sp. CP313]
MPRPANLEVCNRLLHAGGRVIHELGFNASGVQDIVAAANVPKGSFCSYFDSKEAFASGRAGGLLVLDRVPPRKGDVWRSHSASRAYREAV